jgi:hypothetical protein
MTNEEALFMYERPSMGLGLLVSDFTDREKAVFESLLKKFPECFALHETLGESGYYRITKDGCLLQDLLMYGRELTDDLMDELIKDLEV